MTTSDPGDVHAKGDRDLVTDLDLQIQPEVRTYLERATPDIDFLVEEEGGGVLDPEAEYVWTLDPIDGTSNFTHGIPLCATQLALVRLGEPFSRSYRVSASWIQLSCDQRWRRISQQQSDPCKYYH
jgi:myo-inositol-1(or 4)-monophosphatase